MGAKVTSHNGLLQEDVEMQLSESNFELAVDESLSLGEGEFKRSISVKRPNSP